MHDPNKVPVFGDGSVSPDVSNLIKAGQSLGQNGSVVNSPTDFEMTPAMRWKFVKMIKDQQPKHENYRPCVKKCKFYKANACWEKTCLEQKACWEDKYPDKAGK